MTEKNKVNKLNRTRRRRQQLRKLYSKRINLFLESENQPYEKARLRRYDKISRAHPFQGYYCAGIHIPMSYITRIVSYSEVKDKKQIAGAIEIRVQENNSNQLRRAV